MTLKSALATVAAVVAMGVHGHAVAAQTDHARVPVTLALVDQVPGAEAFAVVRRPGQTPADVILLNTRANESELSDAIRTLLAIRSASGDFPAAAQTLRMRPHQTGAVRREFPWVPRVFADLHRASARTVHGVGTVPAVVIWLPRQSRGRTAG